jgi:small-conductance mechanosensitive channel
MLAAGAPCNAAEPVAEAVPPKAAELINLLRDPDVRRWLEQQQSSVGKATDQPTLTQARSTLSTALDARAMVIRDHFAGLLDALPTLPGELQRVALLVITDIRGWGANGVALQLLAVIALGIGVEWLFRRSTAAEGRRLVAAKIETTRGRLLAMTARLGLRLGSVAAFALGAGAGFLLFRWPPVFRELLVEYLVAIVMLRITIVLIDSVTYSGGEAETSEASNLRILPLDDRQAGFWSSRLAALAAWFAIGYATVDLLDFLGLPPPHRRLIAYALGLGLLAIALETVWRQPPRTGNGPAPRRRLARWSLTAYFLLLWVSWASFALNLLWLSMIGGALLLVLRTLHRAIPHVLRAPSAERSEALQPTMVTLCFERGVRGALIIGAVVLLAQKWNLDLSALTTGDTMIIRLARGLIGAIVIAVLANFAWDLIKTAIDRKLAQTAILGPPETPESRRQARLRTLLPMFRTVTMIVLSAVAVMMALASLGIEIGPLIAGAGVIGLAIGFGAQTLVRDVISGMFYLLDDAFRVGEYIESGNYKGTVESFNLRSVKLRHHRGPLYTVPFGVLGAVKNMSRDWVIDKLMVSIDYDSDLDKAKKLIKEIGKALAADPEFAPNILGPLKMQGIEQFADYGIQIRMKMTTRPGEQFSIRRKAYKLIKDAFDANGIKFSVPTVQVAGESQPGAAAAARRILEPVREA